MFYIVYCLNQYVRQYGIVELPTLASALQWLAEQFRYVESTELLAFQDTAPSLLTLIGERETIARELSDGGRFEIERDTFKRLNPNCEFFARLATMRLGINLYSYEGARFSNVLADLFYDAMSLAEIGAFESKGK